MQEAEEKKQRGQLNFINGFLNEGGKSPKRGKSNHLQDSNGDVAMQMHNLMSSNKYDEKFIDRSKTPLPQNANKDLSQALLSSNKLSS